MKKLPKEIEDILKKPLDPKAITRHPTKTYLSSIKAVYVTERFNDAFGIGGWTTKVDFQADGGKGMIVVKVIFEVPEYSIYYECFGGNDNGGEGNKNFDLGDAYKGATTDALTKIGSYMGVAMDVFKGLTDNKPVNTTDKNEPENWLNLFDKQGNKTKAYNALETAIAEGKKYTLSGIRKNYKVSKKVAEELKTNFNIQ